MVALLVITTIVICIGVDALVQMRRARGESMARRLVGELVPAEAFENLAPPSDVFLSEGHTWAKVSPTGTVDVGPDVFAQNLIGRVDAVVLPEVGKTVRRGEMLFALRQDNRRAAFASPLDGVVTHADEHLNWHPETLRADPYRYGRVCSLRPKNLAQSLKQFRAAEEAAAWLGEEAGKFQEFFAARPVEEMRLGQVLQDGGRPAAGLLEFADERTWEQFNELFLRPRGDRLN